MTHADPPLPIKVVALAEALEGNALPYAIGGAIAYAYYGEPRATMDIDINVFVPAEAFDDVVRALAPLGVEASSDKRTTAVRDGQVRLWWGPTTAIDLFFAYDAFHYRAAERIRRVPFGETTIPILAPEDLLVCKVVFNRTKDWIDVDQMLLLTAGSLDLDDVRRWVTRIVGADDPRLAHLERAVTQILGDYSA